MTRSSLSAAKGGFDAKSPRAWLQSTRDYLAGRADELGAVLGGAEAQTEPIASEPDRGGGNFPMLLCVSTAEAVALAEGILRAVGSRRFQECFDL